MNITDDGAMTNVLSELAFVQTVTWGKSKVISQNLNLSESWSVTGIYMRPVAQDLGVGHAFTGYIDSPCATKRYATFQGESTVTGAVDPIASELPYTQIANMTDRFLLYHPARGPRTTNIVLRAPEVDNRDRNAYTRVSRETRGGTLYVYRDPSWPKVRTLVVTIIGLSKANVDSVQAMLQDTLGKEVGITDWEGRMWAGVITNPNDPAVENSRGNWAISLVMEGELLDGQYPGVDDSSALNISDSVSYTLI